MESPVMMKMFRSGLMEMERRHDHKTMNCLLPARGIKDVWPHSTFQILVTKSFEEMRPTTQVHESCGRNQTAKYFCFSA